MNNFFKVNKSLPTSITVIGWVYTALGVLLTITGLLFGLGVGFISGFFHAILGVVGGLFLGLFLAVVGCGIVFLGQGLLQKNKAAWVITLVIAILGIFNALGKREGTNLIQLVWGVFVIWKLYEHRKLFDI
ncbi:MAG: hypothetical protein Q8P13_04615 [bacterium]|nr:hypothetical protein [bacterium]